MTPQSPKAVSLCGAAVFAASDASPTEQFAARELSRYLLLLTGAESPVVDRLPEHGTVCVLTGDAALAGQFGAQAGARAAAPPASRGGAVGEQGFRLKAFREDGRDGVVVAAAGAVGVLYGVYTLLEELGMGFYLGGDTFPEPDEGRAAGIAADLDRTFSPAFSVRGNMLHYNFLVGPTTWGLEDYKFYFDQLARMRANVLLMHWYDGEPGGYHEVDGEMLAGGPAPNSLSKPWGALAALRTSEFSFGTGDYFDEEIFASPPAQGATDVITELRRSAAMFSEATRYAKRAGVRVAAGFEEPRGDPTDPDVEKCFRARVRQFLRRNPHLTYFALWNHESGGSVGSPLPAAGSCADALYREQHDVFAYLGHKMRVWEAIRFGRFAQFAREVIQEEAPHLRLVLVGWGGDRWMQFADYCLGYDRLLPGDVIFTCHDNIDASIGGKVSTPWGQLPPERERWAMPWVEGDLNQCWSRQPNVESLGLLAPDALKKGAQGLLTLQWRTRDVEEETGFAALFAWEPELTPERFYRRLARQAFGRDQEEGMGERLGTLQRLGARWTGVSGCPECGRMKWTGWDPHIPFEIDGETALHLRGYAVQAADALAEVPPAAVTDTEAGMFHNRAEEGAEPAAAHLDRSRPGVKEFEQAAERLLALSMETDSALIRRGLKEIEETLYQLRPRLIHFGIPVKCHSPVDTYLIRSHHLTRHGNVLEHFETLDGIWEELAELHDQYVTEGRVQRLERLDYLMATMEFVMDHDSAAVMLAPGEEVDRALAACAELKENEDEEGAADLAGAAYTELIEAGMQDALLALDGRKLTTRNDFGVLCTVNVKAMPLYWDAIGRLEAFLTAIPPRQVRARGDRESVWLEWDRSPGACGFAVYRRAADEDDFERVNRAPLHAETFLFVDRPPAPGRYEYVVAALDENGEESPPSHPVTASCGEGGPPVIVASKPASVAETGVPIVQRVVALGEREIDEVRLCYRVSGSPEWTCAPMPARFRNSYQGVIPGEAVQPGVVLFYVEARDVDGGTSTWPETAPAGLTWSVVVVPAGPE